MDSAGRMLQVQFQALVCRPFGHRQQAVAARPRIGVGERRNRHRPRQRCIDISAASGRGRRMHHRRQQWRTIKLDQDLAPFNAGGESLRAAGAA
jgi:hypothetical protein